MPVITQKELEKQIKQRAFSPVYVIYGSEQMYVSRFTKKLTEAVAGKNPSEFGFHTFSGEVDPDTLASAVGVVPFMSEYNCVLVTDVFFDEMRKDELDKLKAVFSHTVQGTVLILSMPSYVPKRNKSTFESIVKRAAKDGSVIRFEQPDPRTLEKHIAKWANENGKFITQNTALRLMRVCGTDLNRLKNEVDKLCAYAGDSEEVPYEAIDLLVAQNLEARVFSLSDAVLAGKGDEAFNILQQLFNQKESAQMMLYVLANAFTDAYRVRVADESGADLKTVAEDFGYGKRSFALGKARTATRQVSTEALRRCLDAVADADSRMKSVSVNERLLVEQLIARLLLIAKEGRR